MWHTEYASDIFFALCAAQPGLTFIMVAAMQGDRNNQTAGVIHGVRMTCDKPPQNRRQMQRISMFEW